jgi:hypothetical protein
MSAMACIPRSWIMPMSVRSCCSLPYLVSSLYRSRGRYPCGASESEGGGSQIPVKPAALMSSSLPITIWYQSCLQLSQWKPCSSTSRPCSCRHSAPLPSGAEGGGCVAGAACGVVRTSGCGCGTASGCNQLSVSSGDDSGGGGGAGGASGVNAGACGSDAKVANRDSLAWRDREWSSNDGQIPNPTVVRVAPGTSYYRVEGNRRASRNGPVSDLPPDVTNVTLYKPIAELIDPRSLNA